MIGIGNEIYSDSVLFVRVRVHVIGVSSVHETEKKNKEREFVAHKKAGKSFYMSCTGYTNTDN